jgi:hypothetical protein
MNDKGLAIGSWWLVVGCWLLVAGGWLLVFGISRSSRLGVGSFSLALCP